MTTIKHVAIFGASGDLGEPVLAALTSSSKFTITIIKRPSSTGTFPSHLKVIEADYTSLPSLTSALAGIDAVVSAVGTPGLAGQTLFIDAALAAGVKRFIPSDFGSDLTNPKSGALPVFGHKIAVHKKLQEAVRTNPDFSWTSLVNGPFLDWGLDKQFLLAWKDDYVKLYDGGENVFSTTTLASVGQAVVGILSHPPETKNRFVYVRDTDISQKHLLEIVKKIDSSRKFEPQVVSTAEIEQKSNEALGKGQVTMEVMMAYLFRAIFGPVEYGAKFSRDDNELLGVKGKTLEEVEEVVRGVVSGGR